MSDLADQVELIVNQAHSAIERLKDPTIGSKTQMTAEQRNEAREQAAEDLGVIIDSLEALLTYYINFPLVQSIAAKHIHDESTTKP